ncbi:hypothetical protein V0U79_07100 [Hyphobacterium sp. HN65]|uniref:STAS/SEC14 domain-containing protein n=1 Tax=Hyphobacterium lacteum TaxID=3116575 RepID=A0ABU7LQE1_9PROT|nr:hypothetical protein [Hyphobacterium sp. HN65]MEE2526129.1 hypothetical protein [Hyphobacterium sp. HN65]
MTYEIIFPLRGNIVEVQLSGKLTFEMFRDLHAELYFGGQWRTGMNLLAIIEADADPLGIDAHALRTSFREEIERLAEIRGPEFKVAWVVENPTYEPLLQQWKSMPFIVGRYDIEVFRDREQGRAWLEEFSALWPEFELNPGNRSA